MIKSKDILKEWIAEIVKETEKIFCKDGEKLSEIDIKGIEEGFFYKGNNYNCLGSGMKKVVDIVTSLTAVKYKYKLEASMLHESKGYREYKKEMYLKQKKGRTDKDWKEYYNLILENIK